MNKFNVRTSRINNNTMQDFSFFIHGVVQTDPTNSRIRGRGVVTLLSIIKLLDSLKERKGFSRLFIESGFGAKRSFLYYLHFLQHFKLIEKETITKVCVYYYITEKGRILLDLFRDEM